MTPIKTHRSKIDLWLIAVLAASLLLPLGLTILFPKTFILTSVILAPMIGFFLWLFATTKYEIKEANLYISSGPIKFNFPIRDIISVKATRNPLSSPALSLDRLEIKYGSGKTTLISPKDKSNFLYDIGWIEPI